MPHMQSVLQRPEDSIRSPRSEIIAVSHHGRDGELNWAPLEKQLGFLIASHLVSPSFSLRKLISLR